MGSVTAACYNCGSIEVVLETTRDPETRMLSQHWWCSDCKDRVKVTQPLPQGKGYKPTVYIDTSLSNAQIMAERARFDKRLATGNYREVLKVTPESEAILKEVVKIWMPM